ncbi:hypothetical protein J121_404 [Qipengyuania citrea LAMA 915]|uniref:Uncharacterized protein n=1 Tax=Qipengyuania citrea LAMA 915 TaxID=1306953 RepID=A0A0L1KEX9_9SPHN|nr:hypothetical protein [Qipengyuania citrea]KNH02620.1 hypothetical protein J121_404 [Qipengyuania citrea LAMA 915]
MTIVHLLTGLVEIAVAILLWHHAAPALRRIGTWRAWMTWLLGLALALLGVGQIDAWFAGSTVPLLRQLGDVVLLFYAAWRFVHIMRHVPPPHWSETP